tara:strand:- start:553 stop:1263 length:711 start_codon:yes stop_codon:yes gene_type:complete
LGYDSLLDISSDQIKQLSYHENDIIDAIEPLDNKTRRKNKIGFALNFAKHYINFFKEDINQLLIIPNGVANSGFSNHHWNKGDITYELSVNKVLYVLDKYPKSKLVAVLWHQGERDRTYNKLVDPVQFSSIPLSSYQIFLDRFINNIRDDLKNPSVPFILGGMVPYWAQQDSSRLIIQSVIKSTTKRIKRIGYADPEKPFLIQKRNPNNDPAHFDAEGQRELGVRYFLEYLRMFLQ